MQNAISTVQPSSTKKPPASNGKWSAASIQRDLRRNWTLYLMVSPVILFFLLFHYVPMFGVAIAFQDYMPGLGFMDSPWVGFRHFVDFFTNPYFTRLLRNTFMISFYNLIFGFPAPILLAILLNELPFLKYKSLMQSFSYLPHFISTVVICGMIVDFSMTNGLFNDIIVMLGGTRQPLLQNAGLFRTIYIASGIWQSVGWGTIIYLSAISGIDQQLYEAAKIDGAGRFKQIIHVTIPGISSTIIVLLILNMGSFLSIGSEKIILLYNPSIYETADVISTYVYRKGLLEMNWSFSTAVGLFNSIVNFVLLMTSNYFSKKLSETSLL